MYLLPFLSAALVLLIAFYMIMRTRRARLAIVTALLPLVNISVDYLVVGDLTDFRAFFNMLYAFALVVVVNHYINQHRL